MWQEIANGVVAKTTKYRQNTSIIGVTTPISAQSVLSSQTSPTPSNLMSLLHHFLIGLSQVCTGKTLQLKSKESRTLLRPSPIPSNWLETLFSSTNKKVNTSSSSNTWWNAIEALTPHICHNSKCQSYFSSTALKRRYSPMMLSYLLLDA